MNARMALHSLIAVIIEDAVDEAPRSPAQVGKFADQVMAQVDQWTLGVKGPQMRYISEYPSTKPADTTP